jgi:hypothetical protein
MHEINPDFLGNFAKMKSVAAERFLGIDLAPGVLGVGAPVHENDREQQAPKKANSKYLLYETAHKGSGNGGIIHVKGRMAKHQQ